MESEPNSMPKLPLFSIKPEPPGLVSSPLHTSASVPFQWEEEPGKPRPCTTLITLPPTKSLDLPPKLTKLPSPTTVLDGPYIMSKQKKLSSFSFRLGREAQGQEWDFEGSSIMAKNARFSSSSFRLAREGQKGVKVKSGKDEGVDGNFAFSSLMEGNDAKNGSISKLPKPSSHFWATICEGIKQKIPWSNKYSKRGRSSSYNL